MIKLPNIKGLATMGKAAVAAHRPEILFGTSIVTTLSAVVAAAVGGYKSGQQVLLIEQAEDRKVEVKEMIQLTWLNYLPAAGLTAGALGATTGLHIVHVKEKKQLAAAALMAIEEVKEQSKVYVEDMMKEVEKATDPEKAAEIRDNMLDPEKTGSTKIQNSDHTIEELYLVRDAKTGRDIWSNTHRIEEAVNNVNSWIAKHGDCDLNTFYSNAGFESTQDGDDWGWSGAFVELTWDTVVRDDGRPARRFAFRADPEKGYDRPVK